MCILIIVKCPIGMQPIANFSTCELCPKNTYSNTTTMKGDNCTACPVDYITENDGSTSADDCTCK